MTVKINEDSDSFKRRFIKYTEGICCVKTMKKRIPILQWLPNYTLTFFIQDMIAGITVGFTAIAQGIAYAAVAGLPPEYGLYSGMLGGFVYLFFGSCKNITVGPTAIMSALVARYISGYSADFAILAAFLAGAIELFMGILNLGFLVEFISQPVISGFTTAAALQISASQLKALLGLAGSSGNYFAESISSIVQNVSTIQLWDSIFGVFTVIILIFLKWIGQDCTQTDSIFKQLKWFISLARNAIIVIVAIIVAYILNVTTDSEPLSLIGEIASGLPEFKLPPFGAVVDNETYTFSDMVQALGPQSFVIPLVSILEMVAIARALSDGIPVDATQEMIALGLCNIVGSFVSSMPITGSFSRAALNHAAGVQTPAGGIFTGSLVLLSLSLLTSTFYFIPKPTLAGLIITAMYSMIDLSIFNRLWKNDKKELTVTLVTIFVCLIYGLEYGIVTGIILDALSILYSISRPTVEITSLKSKRGGMILVPLNHILSYCASEHVRRMVLQASDRAEASSIYTVIIDGTSLKSIDTTVASNLMSVVNDLEKKSFRIYFLNFNIETKNKCLSLSPESITKFVVASSAIDIFNTVPKSVRISCISC